MYITQINSWQWCWELYTLEYNTSILWINTLQIVRQNEMTWYLFGIFLMQLGSMCSFQKRKLYHLRLILIGPYNMRANRQLSEYYFMYYRAINRFRLIRLAIGRLKSMESVNILLSMRYWMYMFRYLLLTKLFVGKGV